MAKRIAVALIILTSLNLFLAIQIDIKETSSVLNFSFFLNC
jgi:hypothetical protein